MAVESKEHTALAWPSSDYAPASDSDSDDAGSGSGEGDLARARAQLAAEWRAYFAQTEQTPAEVARFYERAQGIGADLDAWHALPERAEWTRMLVHVAQQAAGALPLDRRLELRVVDIGCGAGHDLRALRDALPTADLQGVEPNDALRVHRPDHVYRCAADVEAAAIERADLLICIDVLEHVPDPESFLAQVAQRAPIGCLLFETTATHDVGTPLHLKQNWGWHPGRVLERHGWEMVDRDQTGRVRVWKRHQKAGGQRASLLLCAYRSVALRTLQSVLDCCAGAGATQGNRWRLRVKGGDALIARSRSIIVTSWYRETADDVLLMVDDDIVFGAQEADRLTELCRGGLDIVCGAYPVHDGAHLACRFLSDTAAVSFGPDQPPLEIESAATGFMAVHRRVIDALVRDLPLCHPDQPWSFYPLFRPTVQRRGEADEYLSEDWSFSRFAHDAGFRIWLDPQTRLEHRGEAGISVQNMAAMHAAMQQA